MKHLTPELIGKRFNEVKELENRGKPEQFHDRAVKQNKPTQQLVINQPTKRQGRLNVVEEPIKKEVSVLSKNDIIRSVIKIKPYLEQYNNEIVKSEQIEDFPSEQADLLSEMLIRQNSRLCAQLNMVEQPQRVKISQKPKPGCVFEVYFAEYEPKELKPGEQEVIVDPRRMQNCYAVVTEVLQIYLALADVDPVCTVEMKNIEFVKYHTEVEFDYIKIKHISPVTNRKHWVDIGFISKRQFHLFDRMLFLAKQVSRTSPGRLFDNKLLFQNLENY